MAPQASVIVRAKNEAGTIERTLRAVRDQTVETELLVIDSGSTDGTLEIARTWCDRLITLPPERFRYGLALNLGAREAAAPIHVALSAHCCPERTDWIEQALRLYEREDVAGAAGMMVLPDGSPASEGRPYHQRIEDVQAHPFWGFSNHASSWRAEAWRRHPFDEQLDYAEDKEWALRVLQAGWTVAYDRGLWVDMSHAWRAGAKEVFQRHRRGYRAVGSFVELRPYRLGDLRREWWNELPADRHGRFAHRFLNYKRAAQLAGKWVGRREAPGVRGSTVPPNQSSSIVSP